MIIHGRVFCDLCRDFLGQVWNEPACAPDLLPAPDCHICEDCVSASNAAAQERHEFLVSFYQDLGARPQLHPVRY